MEVERRATKCRERAAEVHFADNFVALRLLFGFSFAFELVLLQAGVALADHALYLGELAGAFCDSHC